MLSCLTDILLIVKVLPFFFGFFVPFSAQEGRFGSVVGHKRLANKLRTLALERVGDQAALPDPASPPSFPACLWKLHGAFSEVDLPRESSVLLPDLSFCAVDKSNFMFDSETPCSLYE